MSANNKQKFKSSSTIQIQTAISHHNHFYSSLADEESANDMQQTPFDNLLLDIENFSYEPLLSRMNKEQKNNSH